MGTTPDVENDVLDLLRAQPTVGAPATIVVRPPDGGAQNAFAGGPKPSKDSGIATQAVFAEYMGELFDHDNDGNNRWFLVDILVRGPRNDEATTKTRAKTISDVVTEKDKGTFGHWIAPISGVHYIDLEVLGMSFGNPGPDDTIMAIVNMRAWFDG